MSSNYCKWLITIHLQPVRILRQSFVLSVQSLSDIINQDTFSKTVIVLNIVVVAEIQQFNKLQINIEKLTSQN